MECKIPNNGIVAISTFTTFVIQWKYYKSFNIMFKANWLKAIPLQGIEIFISQVTTTMCISYASCDKNTKHGIDKWGKKKKHDIQCNPHKLGQNKSFINSWKVKLVSFYPLSKIMAICDLAPFCAHMNLVLFRLIELRFGTHYFLDKKPLMGLKSTFML
jgi:hypothetical protein